MSVASGVLDKDSVLTSKKSVPQHHISSEDRTRCACCSVTNYETRNVHSEDLFGNTFPTNGVHEMLAEIFLLPKDLILEEELRCCYKCSMLIHDGFEWNQNLKKAMSTESKMNRLFQTLQKHNLKIRRAEDSFQSPKQSSNYPPPAITITTVPHESNIARIQKQQQHPRVSFARTPVSTTSGPAGPTATTTAVPHQSISTRIVMIQKQQQLPRISFARIPVSVSCGPTTTTTPTLSSIRFPMGKATNTPGNMRDANYGMENDIVEQENEGEPDPFDYALIQDSSPPENSVEQDFGQLHTVVGTKDQNKKKAKWIGRCKVTSCEETFRGGTSVEQKLWLAQHMKSCHPYFVCCQLCVAKMYGKDAESARELLEKHHEQNHPNQDLIPMPRPETVIAYPAGTTVNSSTCQICSLRFYSLDRTTLKKTLNTHYTDFHQSSIQCTQCPCILKGNAMVIQFRMRQHIEIQHEHKSKYICAICERPLSVGGNVMAKHIMTHMNQEERNAEIVKNPSILKSSLCPICGIVLEGTATSEEQLLKSHMRWAHSSSKKKRERLSCDQCDFTSSKNTTLIRHKLVHVEGAYCKFTCKQCGKGYVAGQWKEYQDHTLVCCDETERPVQCPEPDCFKRFKYKHPVMIHLIGCHKKTPEEARAIMYPGLPMHDWILNLTGIGKKRKRDKKDDNNFQTARRQETSNEPPLPAVKVGIVEAEGNVSTNGNGGEGHMQTRSVRKRNKTRRLDL